MVSAILNNLTFNKRFIIRHAKLLSVRTNFADIYLRGIRDRSMLAERIWRGKSSYVVRRRTRESQWFLGFRPSHHWRNLCHFSQQQKIVLHEELSNWSSGVQIPCDICTRFWCYLYFTKYNWVITYNKLGGDKQNNEKI